MTHTLASTIKFVHHESLDDEELAFIAKMFYKHKHRIVGKRNVHERKEKYSHSIQCFACSGYGHLPKDCANLKVGRPNAHFATLSDSDGDDADGKNSKALNATLSKSDGDEVSTNYVAFVAPHNSYFLIFLMMILMKVLMFNFPLTVNLKRNGILNLHTTICVKTLIP